MIGKLNVNSAVLKYDSDGTAEVTFKIDVLGKHAAKTIIEAIKQGIKDGKDKLTLSVDWFKKSRTLDQNAFMWALLTELADGMNGGRKGDTTPEQLYYEALSKYGIAEFIMALPEIEKTLKALFRIVTIVDKRTVNGTELTVFKCYAGSSIYDTKQMGNLIDGILNDLAAAGIETAQTAYLRGEWQCQKSKA